MKIMYISLLGLILISCSTNKPLSNEAQQKVLVHMSEPIRVIGKDFEERFKKDGLINGEFVAIGSMTNQSDGHEESMRVYAESKARSQLLISAPTEFKRIIQSAISTATNAHGNVEDISVSVIEVKALTGMTSKFSDMQCVTYATPNMELAYDFKKECRVIVKVPAINLQKAYQYTLDKKYSMREQSAIQDLLKEQLAVKMNN